LTGVLEGYRALEFGDYIAPQVLGMLLADQGAEVVKIEPPAGGRLRGTAPFAVWNRSKKSIILDASADATAGIINNLAASADILVADFETLPQGATVTDLHVANPRLITVCLPAFAADHPDADLPPHETIVAAATGIYADRGTGAPSFIAVPHASIFGALTAAPAVVAALLHREATGRGQRIDLPLYNAMFGAMGSQVVVLPDRADEAKPHPVIARFYECGDGRWVNINAGYPRALIPMVRAFGHPEWAAPLLDTESLLAHTEDRQLWIDTLEEVWRARTALEWERIMDEAGVPCTMCRTVEEWLDCDQASAMGAVAEVDDPVFGPLRQVGIQVHLSQNEGSIRRHAPALGEHTAEILAQL
jgi:crotonobetainyl-CoA:carnitine CoA-transferase CaiB-like acyl-CoA transferase